MTKMKKVLLILALVIVGSLLYQLVLYSQKVSKCSSIYDGCWDRLQNTCVIGRERQVDKPEYCAVEEFNK